MQLEKVVIIYEVELLLFENHLKHLQIDSSPTFDIWLPLKLREWGVEWRKHVVEKALDSEFCSPLSSLTANPIHKFMVIGGNKKNGNITI